MSFQCGSTVLFHVLALCCILVPTINQQTQSMFSTIPPYSLSTLASVMDTIFHLLPVQTSILCLSLVHVQPVPPIASAALTGATTEACFCVHVSTMTSAPHADVRQLGCRSAQPARSLSHSKLRHTREQSSAARYQPLCFSPAVFGAPSCTSHSCSGEHGVLCCSTVARVHELIDRLHFTPLCTPVVIDECSCWIECCSSPHSQ
jgi:hypothetical protein